MRSLKFVYNNRLIFKLIFIALSCVRELWTPKDLKIEIKLKNFELEL